MTILAVQNYKPN